MSAHDVAQTWERLTIADDPEFIGTIHDDAVAQQLGYEGAFVPGATIGQFGFREIVKEFGSSWFEGGWYDFRLVSPVYVHSDVATMAERSGDQLQLSVISADGRTCLTGRSGLGTALGQNGAWDPALDGTREPDRVLTKLPIGFLIGRERFAVTAADLSSWRAAARDEHEWFASRSPWGGAVLPPEHLMETSLHMSKPAIADAEDPSEIGSPFIWAQHAAIQHAPAFVGVEYEYTTTIVDKGLFTRTLFLTGETVVRDDNGATVATVRQTLKWMRKDV